MSLTELINNYINADLSDGLSQFTALDKEIRNSNLKTNGRKTCVIRKKDNADLYKVYRDKRKEVNATKRKHKNDLKRKACELAKGVIAGSADRSKIKEFNKQRGLKRPTERLPKSLLTAELYAGLYTPIVDTVHVVGGVKPDLTIDTVSLLSKVPRDKKPHTVDYIADLFNAYIEAGNTLIRSGEGDYTNANSEEYKEAYENLVAIKNKLHTVVSDIDHKTLFVELTNKVDDTNFILTDAKLSAMTETYVAKALYDLAGNTPYDELVIDDQGAPLNYTVDATATFYPKGGSNLSGYSKYLNTNTNYDLSILQIYNDDISENEHSEKTAKHCLIHSVEVSLKDQGADNSTITDITNYMKLKMNLSRSINVNEMGRILHAKKIKANVYQYRRDLSAASREHITLNHTIDANYTVNIISYKGHFMPYIKSTFTDNEEDKKYSTYSILKKLEKEDAFILCPYNIRRNKVDKDSLEIDELLYSNDTALEQEIFNDETNYCRITCPTTTDQINKVIESEKFIYAADFESIISPDGRGNNHHLPFALGYMKVVDSLTVEQLNNGEISESQLKEQVAIIKCKEINELERCKAITIMLDFISAECQLSEDNPPPITKVYRDITGLEKIKTYQPKKGRKITPKIYFHNLKYDAAMIKLNDNIEIKSEQVRGSNLYKLVIKYNKREFIFLDSYKMIPKGLSGFKKMLGLNLGKMTDFNQYDAFTVDNIGKENIPVKNHTIYTENQLFYMSKLVRSMLEKKDASNLSPAMKKCLIRDVKDKVLFDDIIPQLKNYIKTHNKRIKPELMNEHKIFEKLDIPPEYVKNGLFDHMRYMDEYLIYDVMTLSVGLATFNKVFEEDIFRIDVNYNYIVENFLRTRYGADDIAYTQDNETDYLSKYIAGGISSVDSPLNVIAASPIIQGKLSSSLIVKSHNGLCLGCGGDCISAGLTKDRVNWKDNAIYIKCNKASTRYIRAVKDRLPKSHPHDKIIFKKSSDYYQPQTNEINDTVMAYLLERLEGVDFNNNDFENILQKYGFNDCDIRIGELVNNDVDYCIFMYYASKLESKFENEYYKNTVKPCITNKYNELINEWLKTGKGWDTISIMHYLADDMYKKCDKAEPNHDRFEAILNEYGFNDGEFKGHLEGTDYYNFLYYACELEDKYKTLKYRFVRPILKNIYQFQTINSMSRYICECRGVFNGVQYTTNIVEAYIQKSVVGGHTQSLNDKPQLRGDIGLIKKILTDKDMNPKLFNEVSGDFVDSGLVSYYDIVSSYPYAYTKIIIPKGLPERIQPNINVEGLDVYSEYVIHCKFELTEKQQIPFATVKDETGRRRWSNDVKEAYLTRVGLSNLIEFQGLKNLEIISGLGWLKTNGTNDYLKYITYEMFNRRAQAKKDKNDGLSEVLKLFLNGIYGGTLLRDEPRGVEWKYFKDENEKLQWLIKNKEHVLNYNHIMNDVNNRLVVRVEMEYGVFKCKNRSHIGAFILSESKNTLNEVLHTLNCIKKETNGKLGEVLYCDTDSIKLQYDVLPRLKEEYTRRFGRELDGKLLGQWHVDFSTPSYWKDQSSTVNSILNITLAPKTYLDVKTNSAGEIGYHIRFKGSSAKNIISYCIQNDISLIDMYLKAYSGIPISMNIVSDDVRFEFNKKGNYVRLKEMRDIGAVRNFCFNDKARQILAG